MTIDIMDRPHGQYPTKIELKPGDIFTNVLGMAFAWIPPGNFLMGSPADEEGRTWEGCENQGWGRETQHWVTLNKGFFMGVYPITQSQWQMVMGNNPSDYTDAKHPVKPLTWLQTLLGAKPNKQIFGDKHPVEMVSWDDCQLFCKMLSREDGMFYRLPTEEEWEYACRAGTTTAFHFGRTIHPDQANFNPNLTPKTEQTTPVGSYQPNAWGLHDMHGNVWEWCADSCRKHSECSERLLKGATIQEWTAWCRASPGKAMFDFTAPIVRDAQMTRGGSWNYAPEFCRSANRRWVLPGERFCFVGCRVILDLD